MASLMRQIQEALLEDPILAAEHEGRVYRRPLKPRGNRSTPEAYDADGRLRSVSLVITDEGDLPDQRYDSRAYGLMTIWIHGPDSEATQELILEVVGPQIIKTITDPDRTWVGYDGSGVELNAADRYGVREDPGHTDAIMEYIRVSTAKLWRID
jgi:hypothetical protein